MFNFSSVALFQSFAVIPVTLALALSLVKDNGSVYHYEGVVDKDKYMDLFDNFSQIAEKNKYSCKLISHRFVKSYGPNLYHVVLDIRVSEKN